MTDAPAPAATGAAAPRANPPRIAVILLCYKSEPFIKMCLDALAGQTRPADQVVVVENASGDKAAEVARAHPLAPIVIEAPRNLGCAGGNNLGWRNSQADLVLFLNPDCMVEPGFLAAMEAAFAADPRIALVGAKLYYPNSRLIQHAGGILHPNAMTEHIGKLETDTGQFDEPRDVDYVTGAALAARHDVLLALGGFDEEFHPAYYEETDLCHRVTRAGGRIVYEPRAVGYHLESPSLGKGSRTFVRLAYRMRVTFLLKNNTILQYFTRVLPFEFDWFCKPYARGFRLRVLRSYLECAGFALRCLLRWNRRPAGIHVPRDFAQRPARPPSTPSSRG